MPTDRYGLALTTASAAAAEHHQRGMDLLLSYGRGAGEAFDAALAADEGLAVAQAGRALFALFLGDADTARSAMALARERVAGASRRERQHVAAVSALVGLACQLRCSGQVSTTGTWVAELSVRSTK